MKKTQKQRELKMVQIKLGCLVATNSRALQLRGKDPSSNRPSLDRIASLNVALSSLPLKDLSTLYDIVDTAETLYLANTHKAFNVDGPSGRVYHVKRLLYIEKSNSYLATCFDLSVAVIKAEEIDRISTDDEGHIVIEIHNYK